MELNRHTRKKELMSELLSIILTERDYRYLWSVGNGIVFLYLILALISNLVIMLV